MPSWLPGNIFKVSIALQGHIMWTDGYSYQFKNTHAWYFVSRYPYFTTSNSNPNGCSLIWIYFCHWAWKRGGGWNMSIIEEKNPQTTN